MGRHASGTWDDKSGRYYARIGPPKKAGGRPSAVMLCHPDGRPIARGDKGAVASAIRRIEGGRDEGRQLAALGPSVAEVCRAYVQWQADRGAADRTVADHRGHLNRFCRFAVDGRMLGTRAAATITPDDVWAIREAHEGKLRGLVLSVYACWRWAARPIQGREPKRYFEVNPLLGIDKPSAGSRTDCEIDWPTARTILRAARAYARERNPHDRRSATTRLSRRLRALCLHLIAAVGVRPFEAWQLRRDEVQWDEGMIAIAPARDKRRRPGRKPKQARRFVVPPHLLRALAIVQAWPRANPEWVFAIDERLAAPAMHEWHRWLREDLKPYVDARIEGLPADWTGYWLRHAAINAALRGGVSAELAGDQFGNSAEAIRGSYAQASDQTRKRVAETVKRTRRLGGK